MCDKCGCGDTPQERTFEEKVKEAIDAVRPSLQSHGGDVELVETDQEKNVKLRLQGACRGCPGATMTMKLGIERILRERIPEVNEVLAVE